MFRLALQSTKALARTSCFSSQKLATKNVFVCFFSLYFHLLFYNLLLFPYPPNTTKPTLSRPYTTGLKDSDLLDSLTREINCEKEAESDLEKDKLEIDKFLKGEKWELKETRGKGDFELVKRFGRETYGFVFLVCFSLFI